MQYHPDVNKDASATKKMAEINEAYNVLSDPEKRKKYDQFGEAGLNSDQFTGGHSGGYQQADFSDFFSGTQGGGSFFEDLIGNFFGQQSSYGGSNEASSQKKGSDIFFETALTYEEAAVTGKKIQVQLDRMESCEKCKGTGAKEGTQPKTCSQCQGSGKVMGVQNTILGSFRSVTTCPKCQGKGKVIENPCPSCNGTGRNKKSKRIDLEIPSGLTEGVRIRYRGMGNAGYQGAENGDLYVQIRLKVHEHFQRKGNDLIYQTRITFPEAVMGTNLTIPGLYGTEKIKIPPGTESGAIFTIKNKGMPYPTQSKRKGNLVIIVKTIIPSINQLDKESQNLVKELSKKLKS